MNKRYHKLLNIINYEPRSGHVIAKHSIAEGIYKSKESVYFYLKVLKEEGLIESIGESRQGKKKFWKKIPIKIEK